MSEPRFSDATTDDRAAPRKPWTKPTLSILATGSAELNIGPMDDGSDLS